MKSSLIIVSLLVLSSVASAQITQEEAQPSKQGQQGWVQLTSPTSETIVRVRTQPNGDVWLSGTDGLFRSKDLGVNWTKHPDVGKCSISFFDSIHGVGTLGGGQVVLTSDGGDTWIPSGTTGLISGATYLAGPNRVYSVTGGKVSRSTDRGKNWAVTLLDAAGLTTMNFSDELHGFVVGVADVNFTGTCFKTYDGGQSWTRVQCPTYDYWSVACMSEYTILLFSSSGHVARSTNQGQAWTETLLTEPGEGFGGSYALNSMEVFAVAARGQIRYSSDAGATWSSQATTTSASLRNIWFLNDSVGFVAGENGVVLRTSNKGKSWVTDLPTDRSTNVDWRIDDFDKLTFNYSLQRNDRITFSILSIDGRMISEPLYLSPQPAGPQHILFDCRSLAKGAYMYRLSGEYHRASGVFTITR